MPTARLGTKHELAMLDIDDRSESRYFRELVCANLSRAARFIVKVQDELDPQFRMTTPATPARVTWR